MFSIFHSENKEKYPLHFHVN